ncbi:Hypothetical protein CINCED_3A024160 [Cinara cedri]|uniref:Uncharacterized protein n=1 Tax=Cinara cedri TaxID=506608 RepID=A0A5E4MD67_9HEMI|nr:Hypothetical protein CINCED_3A024160 [Cinara cedri]
MKCVRVDNKDETPIVMDSIHYVDGVREKRCEGVEYRRRLHRTDARGYIRSVANGSALHSVQVMAAYSVVGIANIFSSMVNTILNPVNIISRKIVALPETTESHLQNDTVEAKHPRDLACQGFVKLCDNAIGDGLHVASPVSGQALQTALLPKRYGALNELRKTTTMMRRTPPSKRQVNRLVTKFEFIEKIYNFRIRSETIVWSFVNDFLKGHGDDLQVRSVFTLSKSVAPKLFKTYSTNSWMSLEMKKMIDMLKETRLTDGIHESPDKPTEEKLIKLVVDFTRSLEPLYDNLQAELQLEMTDKPDESIDIERSLTSSLISSLTLDQVGKVVSMNHTAFANGTEQMLSVTGGLLAGLVNSEKLLKYSVVKGFYILLNDQDVSERYPNVPDLLRTTRNAFENRLNQDKPVIAPIYGVNRTFQLADCNLHTDMVNVEFLELLIKFKTKFNATERRDLMRLLKPVVGSMLYQSHVHVVASINYTALYNEGENIRINAGKLLAKLVSAKLLQKSSVAKGLYKVLTDDEANEYFTNVPDLLATIRTAYENELYGQKDGSF